MTVTGDQCRNNAIQGTRFCYISSHGDIQKTFRQRAGNFVQNKWLTFALTTVSVVLAALGLCWYLRDKKMNATSGVISSPAQQTPMAVSVGSAEFVMLSKDGVVFDDGRTPLLSIQLVDGRLLVTTEVRGEGGELIAEMKNNEWKHQPQPAIFDRNYTKDALEIKDKGGKVVLQVANLGSTVDVAAVFHCVNGWTYMVGPIGGEGSAIELRRPGQSLQYEIPPICDYPSDLHFGSCPGVEGLTKITSRIHAIYPLHFPVHLCL
jgi:hypothetical protein